MIKLIQMVPAKQARILVSKYRIHAKMEKAVKNSETHIEFIVKQIVDGKCLRDYLRYRGFTAYTSGRFVRVNWKGRKLKIG